MRFNQFSYVKKDQDTILKELKYLGFALDPQKSPKENLIIFLNRFYFSHQDPRPFYAQLTADLQQDLESFLESSQPLSDKVFYTLAFQLLGFYAFIDFKDVESFRKESNFPILYGDIIENLYQLLSTRTKMGNILIDQLVSNDLLEENNQLTLFNDKSLATFSTHDAIREVVYVQTPFDTDGDGQADLIKVNIVRPRSQVAIPAVMTASPYQEGVNGPASDQSLQKMNQDLLVKETKTIQLQETNLALEDSPIDEHTPVVQESQEKAEHLNTYTLNDYLLARGYANIYVSGLGTRDSEGNMTNGDYHQVQAFKAVIDWLNGRQTAYTSRKRTHRIQADWSNGKVATTGLSYLGTMSNGLATTGVDGLEVVIAEAGISSWYNYYRENGLVTSPGGYPGEDFDSLDEFTYSRDLRGGDYIRYHKGHQVKVARLRKDLDRAYGDYSQFWQDRNYRPQADQVKAQVVFTHGLQDWNVKPSQVFHMFHALPETVSKHLFLHHGAHVYMNNWQSIDFRESINALLTKKLWSHSSDFELPKVIWQDNTQAQTWHGLDSFAGSATWTQVLGAEEQEIPNAYPSDRFQEYSEKHATFTKDLHAGQAQAIVVEFPIDEDRRLNGRPVLRLRVKSSANRGLLSAKLLEVGRQKRLQPIPAVISPRALDNGRYYYLEDLKELPFADSEERIISKGYLNLQNRKSLLEVESVEPGQWMDLTWELEPSIYQLKKDGKLKVLLYTTDFEVTIRDNSDYRLTIDLEQSQLELPIDKNT